MDYTSGAFAAPLHQSQQLHNSYEERTERVKKDQGR